MPFEPGNQLAAKRKQFEGALRRALAQDNADRLRRACERLLDSAAEGATWAERIAALQFLADRLDGRVLPQLPDAGDGTLVVSWVMQAPSTSERSLSTGEVIDHSPPANASLGTIRADDGQAGGVREIETDGGVGGGGVTPPHTVEVPVPLRTNSSEDVK